MRLMYKAITYVVADIKKMPPINHHLPMSAKSTFWSPGIAKIA
jgi:hypothetical protein